MIKLKSLLMEIEHSLTNTQLTLVERVPSRLYHATFSTAINSISKSGLIPGRSTGTNFHETDKRFVYLAASAEGAKNVIEHLISSNRSISQKYGHEVNVLTINGSKLDKKKLYLDPYSQALMVTSYMYNAIIPASFILDYGD